MFRRLLAAVGLCSADTPASLAAANARRGELSASAISVESAAATHELTVEGYSRAKAVLATGSCARSSAFAAGGHRWRILYFPNGELRDADDWIGVYPKLEQPSPAADVMARYSFSLLDHAGEPVPWCCANTTGSFSSFNTRTPIRGYRCFVEKKVLEASAYLRDDSFRIRCVIVVFGNEISTEDRDAAAAAVGLAGAPPLPDIGRHLGGLLSGGEGADVTFDVGGEMFHAHRP